MGAFDDLKPAGAFDDIPIGKPPAASLLDMAKTFGAGALEGTGHIFKGGGDALTAAINYIAREGGLGDPGLRAENPLAPAAEVLTRSITPAGRFAMEESTPVGDVTKPSTWGFRGEPTLSGGAANVANVLGQFAPNLAVALTTGGLSLPAQLATGAAVGGAQAYGAASQEELDRIMQMGDADLGQIPMYAELLRSGVAPANARQMVAEAAAAGGGFGSGIPSSLEGAVENALIPAILRGRVPLPRLAGRGGAAGRAATGALVGVGVGGAEEAIERMGQTYGANVRTGEAREVTADTFPEFVLGGLAEGTVGAGLGALSRGRQPPESPRDSELRRAADIVVGTQNARQRATDAGEPGPPDVGGAPPPPAPAAPLGPYGRERDALSALREKQFEAITPEDRNFLLQGQLARETKTGRLALLPAGRRRLTALDQAANEAATSPTNERPEPSDAQKEAGNYKLGHIMVGGLDISVENPEGSTRRSHADAPVKWETTMQGAHYGYVKGVPARAPDKDHVDVFVKPGTPDNFAGQVFVIDQNNASGTFDEPKVMVGYASQEEARAAYLGNYDKGWEKRVRGVTPLPMEQFKAELQTDAFQRPHVPNSGTAQPNVGMNVGEAAQVPTPTPGAQPPSAPQSRLEDLRAQAAQQLVETRNFHPEDAADYAKRLGGEKQLAGFIADNTPEALAKLEEDDIEVMGRKAFESGAEASAARNLDLKDIGKVGDRAAIGAWLRGWDRAKQSAARAAPAQPATPLPTAKAAPSQEGAEAAGGALVPARPTQVAASNDAPYYVEFGGNRYPVVSIIDARDKWNEFRDSAGGRGSFRIPAGVSEVGNGIIVRRKDGTEAARISYNGRMWTGPWGEKDTVELVQMPGTDEVATIPQRDESEGPAITVDTGTGEVTAKMPSGEVKRKRAAPTQSSPQGVIPGEQYTFERGDHRYVRTIQPLTQETFSRHLRSLPEVRTKRIGTLAQYLKAFPGNTHINLLLRDDGGVFPGNPLVGSPEQLRPKPEAKETRVESFDAEDARLQAARDDQDARKALPTEKRAKAKQDAALATPVTIDAIEAETGRSAKVTRPASEALADIDQDIEKVKGLLQCLKS